MFIYILDLIILPKETRILQKINKLWNEARDILDRLDYVRCASSEYGNKKIFKLMDIKIQMEALDTEEHIDKVQYYSWFIGIIIVKFESEIKRMNNWSGTIQVATTKEWLDTADKIPFTNLELWTHHKKD